MCRIAEKFANGRYDKDVKEAARCFNTPESVEVLNFITGERHWALKRNNPTVKFPLKIANILRGWYNEQNPHCSADEAAARLVLVKEYRKSLYVRYVMEATKIKAFFSTLKAKKVNGVVPELAELTESSDGYKHWTTVPDMKQEYTRRVMAGTMAKLLKKPTNKHGWAMALELNDLQLANTVTNSMEEAAYAKGVEDGLADNNAEDSGDEGEPDDGDADGGLQGAPEDAHLEYQLLGDDTISDIPLFT